MDRRLELQAVLELITPNVYFQPPPDVRLEYPCIIYKRDAADTKHADNVKYAYRTRYMVTVVDRDPDSPIPELLRMLPMSEFTRFYTSGDLNHDVHNLFF